MNALRGFTCDIYRNRYNPGPINVFHDVDEITISGSGLPEMYDANAVLITEPVTPHDCKRLPRIEPTRPGWYAFGGSFAYSCDSRFPDQPIPIFDRDMSMEVKTGVVD